MANTLMDRSLPAIRERATKSVTWTAEEGNVPAKVSDALWAAMRDREALLALLDAIELVPELVTTKDAAKTLGLEAQTLRGAANQLRDGTATNDALAGRLGMRRIGRDWLIPRHLLDVEVARRARGL